MPYGLSAAMSKAPMKENVIDEPTRPPAPGRIRLDIGAIAFPEAYRLHDRDCVKRLLSITLRKWLSPSIWALSTCVIPRFQGPSRPKCSSKEQAIAQVN